MPTARTISALILVGSLVGCSSNGLPTQRAYNVANLEQPQAVSFHCGTLVAVAPAILPIPSRPV
jgi:outer membrane lipoprotein SlyB